MSSLPQPPSMQTSRHRSSSSEAGYSSPTGRNGSQMTPPRVSMSSLPPPPAMKQTSNYAQNLARSMTIEEMRELHRRALSEAEAKQTELRLVLASRYRELVGSSDEVTKMRERAQELYELVGALPELMEKLVNSTAVPEYREDSKTSDSVDLDQLLMLRHKLATLPRLIHRALDRSDVHQAAESLLELFRLIASQTDEYPLATALARGVECSHPGLEDLVRTQMRMTFLHVQTLPAKITRISKHILNHSASYGTDPKYGAQRSASALSTLELLDMEDVKDGPIQLVDQYFDAKAQLLQGLLNQLTSKDQSGDGQGASNAEGVLSKIVLILQYDIILHPYQIFILRNFPTSDDTTAEIIMKSSPMFPAPVVQAKVSKFLSAHLPLIRTKVKSVLVEIAGTTASALGKIRQSLYDKTDGAECKKMLDSNGVCTWEEAISGVIDVPNVFSSASGGPMTYGSDTERKFSLWTVLFSNTFSSLVHSLLTTAFQSVHTKVVSALRLSIANAPPLSSLLPHEAYRNTLYIATELDTALLKVREDAHELLVHAEERVESETRLKQSLYVQTCEIMGRLICELRQMLSETSGAAKHLIVGRLCHLLKFRLTALPNLLDAQSSPAVLHGSSGMISLLDLSSAFDLADDNDDGLIAFQEAMEAVNSAFSGTQLNGAEVVRETLLLAVNDEDSSLARELRATKDVTLNELTLLLARGLRHDSSGEKSALGCIQGSLDDIVRTCFDKWALDALNPHRDTLSAQLKQFVQVASSYDEEEYKRIYAHGVDSVGGAAVNNVSPHVIKYLEQIAFTLNRSVCPSDSLDPVPFKEYAISLGIDPSKDIPCFMTMLRSALLGQGLSGIVSALTENIDSNLLRHYGPSSLVQLKSDLGFVGKSFFRRNQHGFQTDQSNHEAALRKLSKEVDSFVRRLCDKSVLAKIEENHANTMEACDLFLTSLLGHDDAVSAPLGDLSGTAPRVGTTAPFFYAPLPSSCRFALLPIQSDRTLSGVQARGKYKEKEEAEQRADAVGSGAVRVGLGFFSSMLKKS